MTEHKYTDEEVIKAFDILNKFEFFGGQRAGRELWFNKPTDIQNKDIGGFLRDLDFLKQFINRQKTEIERLTAEKDTLIKTYKECMVESIKEFAEKLKKELTTGSAIMRVSTLDIINDLVKELTEEKP